jgi:hypothetical protein
MLSQSVAIGSQTYNFFGLSLSNQYMRSEEFACAQNALANNMAVIGNLNPTNVTEFYQDPNPNLFFPRVGLFTADFALGTVLNQK